MQLSADDHSPAVMHAKDRKGATAPISGSLNLSGSCTCRRLVGPRLRPECDRDSVPGADLRDDQCQSYELGLTEFLADIFV